jgi:spore maturation protein CgeB
MDSKVYINTLSPMGLVSPRFFECMASGSLVFCEESELYKKIFLDGTYVTFKKDLSDFDKKFFYYLGADDERVAITEKAHAEVQGNHTWKKRVKNLLQAVKNYPKGS